MICYYDELEAGGVWCGAEAGLCESVYLCSGVSTTATAEAG